MGCGIKGVDARSLSVWLLLGSSPLLKRGIPSLICNVYYQETYQAIVISRVKIIRIVKKKIPHVPLFVHTIMFITFKCSQISSWFEFQLLFLTDNDMGDHC